jgi:3-hydroxyacyl-CoA dehydrogenase
VSELVQLTTSGNIAIITINNPPVNAFSNEVIEALARVFDQFQGDDKLKTAVITGAGSTFVAGADIKQFVRVTTGEAPYERKLTPLFARIEASEKPVIAAIHGNALGGGLEMAMSTHYRLAAPNAQVGQPEVKLGIIPGAGGTQRLPRLAGVAKACEMCAGGAPIKAKDALAAGILDRIVDGDLLTTALEFAKEVADKPLRRTRDRSEKLGTANANALVFAAAREASRKKQRGLEAPLAAIDSVEAATKLPFDEGIAAEERLFHRCLFSEQSKALVHVFFGEREVSKIPDIPKETATLPVNGVAVVGAGTMGGGIAMVFANAGVPVLLKETDQAALDRGIAKIQKNYATSVERGRFTQAFVGERLKLIRPTLTYDEFAQADLVVEAVFEAMAMKKQVFGELAKACRPGAILASNTSTLNIDEIAAAASDATHVIGLHFFSPANVMKLLEIVRGKATDRAVIATCLLLAKKIGKTGVLVGNCFGFLGNRMFLPYIRQAQFLVEEGASPETVDEVLYKFGMAMGPLATGDLAGIDVGWRIHQEIRKMSKSRAREPFAEDLLYEMGRYGQKTGSGWYRYDENRRPSPDPEVVARIHEEAKTRGIPQRNIPQEEILDRCVYALINEGARVLEDGIALRAVDIDITYLNGYGFPAYRGGPMWYADTIGLKNVYERLREFEREHDKVWAPAPLLEKLAREGRTFADFSARKFAAA